jgi:hypothetical protein
MNQATSERHEQASVRYDWNEVVRLQHQSRIDSGAHGPSSSSPTRHLPSGNQVQRWLPTRSMDRLRLGRWNSSPGVPSPAPSWPMCQPAQSSSESVISQMRSVKVRLWTSPHPILPLKAKSVRKHRWRVRHVRVEVEVRSSRGSKPILSRSNTPPSTARESQPAGMPDPAPGRIRCATPIPMCRRVLYALDTPRHRASAGLLSPCHITSQPIPLP